MVGFEVDEPLKVEWRGRGGVPCCLWVVMCSSLIKCNICIICNICIHIIIKVSLVIVTQGYIIL